MNTTEIRWTDGALKRMERAPIFLRGMVRRLAEKKARELGYEEITEEILEQFKGQMMGRMGGETGMASAVEEMVNGRLPWTAAAKERLDTNGRQKLWRSFKTSSSNPHPSPWIS
jgi:hypothetical protein